jgi:hypothetical protein
MGKVYDGSGYRENSEFRFGAVAGTEIARGIKVSYRLCQGMTSVMPPMFNLDFGLSRCGIAIN